ncbi:MAG: lysine--tRNA ligase, partial [Gemmataceae bacterium]|nr:lysine--tRNA ligase [Gemmataceae bacterium]
PTAVATVAGRVVFRRIQGNVHFLGLQDLTGRVQVMVGKKQVGDVGRQVAQDLDLGDIVGVKGIFGRTRMGEPTVRAESLTFLTKSLEPHPTDYYGMADEEYRLRHRYLDLIYTPDSLRRATQRSLIVRTIRNYLDGQGFLEVETPTLHAIAGGAAARPFVTHHNTLDIDLYLRIALELHLKRLLVGGLERVYEIGRVFRNEGISRKHNPEFTMLELYQAYGDYRSMMDVTEGMFLAAIDAIDGVRERPYGDVTIDFAPPWPRERYPDLFARHVGVAMDDTAGVRKRAAEAHLEKVEAKEHDVLVHELFEHFVEPELAKSNKPVFVCDYPAALCPLTKRSRENPAIAERFELYVLGMELANAYTELNDPMTQEECFRRQLTGMAADESMAKMDDDFVRALRHGMPPAGGLGVGIDRLVMLLTNTTTIRDVILFPLLRPGRTE